MPTFAFLYAPPFLADLASLQYRMLPYQYTAYTGFQRFGTNLDARLLSMLVRSTSELLRTL